MKYKDIYIVASYTDTIVGKFIRGRAKLKFWNRYDGDCYSHISLSLDLSMENMMSFARKKINNPFKAGLIAESIKEGLFARNPEKSKMAIMKISVTEEQYNAIKSQMKYYWNVREKMKYNFPGLFCMLLIGRGKSVNNRFLCSEWCASVLEKCGLDLFNHKCSCNVRPFDFYCLLKKNIIFEGAVSDYVAGTGAAKYMERNSGEERKWEYART